MGRANTLPERRRPDFSSLWWLIPLIFWSDKYLCAIWASQMNMCCCTTPLKNADALLCKTIGACKVSWQFIASVFLKVIKERMGSYLNQFIPGKVFYSGFQFFQFRYYSPEPGLKLVFLIDQITDLGLGIQQIRLGIRYLPNQPVQLINNSRVVRQLNSRSCQIFSRSKSANETGNSCDVHLNSCLSFV